VPTSSIARSPIPIAAKRPLVVVTDRGQEKPVIRHIRFSVDRAVADNDLLRERAIREGIKTGIAQLEAEGWRFLRVELDEGTGAPRCRILPHVDPWDSSYVDPGLPTVPDPPPRDSTPEQRANYARLCGELERAQKAYQARDFADVRDLVDIRVFVRFTAPRDVIVRSVASTLRGSKR
jgi:hypothetical protein